MSKNYIEEFLNDNDIELNTEYKFTNYFDENGKMHDIIILIDDYYNIKVGDNMTANGEVYRQILKGDAHLEKIKYKTLMEQLKHKGVFYVIDWDGHISYLDLSVEIQKDSRKIERYDRQIKQGNVFLTKSEAEREVYRRELEFEMKEWARENDCIGIDVIHDMNVYAGFNVFVKKELWNKGNELAEIFKEKTQKYYNWSE